MQKVVKSYCKKMLILVIVILIIVSMLIILKLLRKIKEATVEKLTPSNDIIDKMSKSFGKPLAKRLLITKDWLLGVSFDNLNVKTTNKTATIINVFKLIQIIVDTIMIFMKNEITVF